MFQTFIVIPPYVPNHGRVVGQFVSFEAEDGSSSVPRVKPLNGTVTFIPRTAVARWPGVQDPFTSVAQRVVAPVVDGVLRKPGYDPETDNPNTSKGVVLTASELPDAEPSTLQWTVQFNLEGVLANPGSFVMNVPDMGVVDLATVVPASPEPGTVHVVSAAERVRAEAAAQAAEAARDQAVGARDDTLAALNYVNSGWWPTYDPALGEYPLEEMRRWLEAKRDNQIYGVKAPKSTATTCVKTDANAGMEDPTPGVIGRPAVDPYEGVGPFFTIECNAYVDEDGFPHVTALEGDPSFSRTGTDDVWILAPTLWWQITEDDTDVTIRVSDTYKLGFESQPKAFLPDGRRRPFMLYAKYAMSMTGTTPRSISGGLVRTRDVSHNSLITICKNSATGYSGKSFADDWYVKAMFLLKYATKNSQSVFAGHTSYSVQLNPAVGETGVKRVMVTKAEGAQILVGSTWSLGTGASTNRTNVATRDIFESARVISKQDIGDQTSVVFDAPNPFNTATTQLLSVMPWRTGACDDVPGDGSPYNPLSGAEPFTIQGIEIGLGAYETLGDVILSSEGEGWSVMLLADSKQAATSVTANYANAGPIETTDRAWKYPLHPASLGGLLIGAGGYTGSSTIGMADGSYINPDSTVAARQWLSLGNLGNGANAGLWIVHGLSSLGSVSWDIASRLSAVGRAG